MAIFCCTCDKYVNAEKAYGCSIYPHRPDLYRKTFWRCPECGNYTGCHPRSDKPLGTIPTKEVRVARVKVHGLIDPLWRGKKNSRRKRNEIYKAMSRLIGKEFHTAEINSREEAIEAWRAGMKIKNFIKSGSYNLQKISNAHANG
jgi:hypothetical protein